MRTLFVVFSLVLTLFVNTPCYAYSVTGLGDSQVDSTFMNMQAPLDGAIVVTSPYSDYREYTGRPHHGVDIGASLGQPVKAVAHGFVYIAEAESSFIAWVVIDHGGGYYSVYGDLDDGSWGKWLTARKGQEVNAGDVIGFIGGERANVSQGGHLHFEIRTDNLNSFLRPAYYAAFAPWMPLDADTGMEDNRKLFDASVDFVSPIKEAIDTIVEACAKGQTLIMGIIKWVLVTLITIDLALSAIMASIDRNGFSGGFTKWFIYKLLLYVLLIYTLTNWTGMIANFTRDFFVDLGGVAAGVSSADAAKAVYDPLDIITKGAKIIEPVFPLLTEIESAYGIDFIGALAKSTFCLVCIIVIFGCFILIAYQIVMAYIEFYIMILFSFVNFMFAGLKQTRYMASRGLNGIFSSSLKLFFFCFFSVCLQNVLGNMVVSDLTTMGNKSFATNGSFSSVADIAAAIRTVESGGRYDVYNVGSYSNPNATTAEPYYGSGAYGAYQQMPEFWDGRVAEYANAYGITEQQIYYMSNNGNPSNSPSHAWSGWTFNGGLVNTHYGWSPQLQDAVSIHMMEYYLKDKPGDYRYVATRWFGAVSDDYWAKICQAGGQMKNTSVLNVGVALKLMLVCLMFVYMGDKIGSNIIRVFGGGNGFRFTNGD